MNRLPFRGVRTMCAVFALLFASTMAAALHEAATASARPGKAQGSPLGLSRQVLVVVTDGWDTLSATLQRYERIHRAAPWRSAGGTVPVVVGKNGLAWGRGLHGEPAGKGPVKREGDGRGPAGVFRLTHVFGQSIAKPMGTAMPYLFLADNVECVDDVRSRHYNMLVTRAIDRVDWTSSEKMWEEPLYKWGIVVAHNRPRRVASAGSCIFLHIWKGPAAGTAGCTAMAEPPLLEIIGWLDPQKSPVLVQLPRAEYARLKPVWDLP